MSDIHRLRALLERLDGKGYKAYQDIRGVYRAGQIELAIDHVQGDPFASPSRVRLMAPVSALNLPEHASEVRRMALENYLARRARAIIPGLGVRRTGTGKSNQIFVDAGEQEVMPRSACRIFGDRVELRLSVGLPAVGRTILGRSAAELLTEALPRLARATLWISDLSEAEHFVDVVEDAHALREQLRPNGLVAFVGDDSILPRESGVSQRPLKGRVVPFRSPRELRVELDTPNSGKVVGMGIPEGVTLIVGGGFHGKSTLLSALARGVYDHVPGDGRERVVARADAVKIRAEDGRRIVGVNLSPFIHDLPLGRSTRCFTTDDASGSTSQAANILEAVEVGAGLLLMDEDTCATNFMVRDRAMRELVPQEAEPIVPLIDRIRQLYEEAGISSILVVGGAGDYFEVADTVIWMHEYRPEVVTSRAKEIASRYEQHVGSPPDAWRPPTPRVPVPASIDPTRGDRTKVKARGTEEVGFGYESIDLRQVEQIVDPSQTRFIGDALVYALRAGIIDGKRTISEVLDQLEAHIRELSIDVISPHSGHPGDYAMARRYEIAAALNRLRTLEVRQRG